MKHNSPCRTNLVIFSSKAKKAKTLNEIAQSIHPEERQSLEKVFVSALRTKSNVLELPSIHKDVLETCVLAGAQIEEMS